MKKIKFLSMILIATMFIFCGCGDLNNNLKLTSSELSVADFYLRSEGDALGMYNLGIGNTSSANGIMSLNSFYQNVFGGLEDMNAVMCTIDFWMALNSKNKDQTTQRIYENTYSQNSQYVVVNKSGNKNFETSVYTAPLGMEFNDAVENGDKVEYKFTGNLNSSKYSLGYKNSDNNDCTVEVYYDASNGYMDIIVGSYNSSISNKKITSTISICQYKNNTYGARVLVEYTAKDGGNGLMAYECLKKDFYARAKIGKLDSVSDYKDLKQITEDALGATTECDSQGCCISVNALLDNSAPTINVLFYGTN